MFWNKKKRFLTTQIMKNRTIKYFSLLLFFIGFAAYSHAQQNFLIMSKPGSTKRYYFYIGNEIIFKTMESDYFETNKIVGIQKDQIIFPYNEIPYSYIKTIKLNKNTEIMPWRQVWASGVSILGSLGIWNLALLVNTGKPSEYLGRELVFFTGLVALPVVLNLGKRAFTKKEYQINESAWKLEPVILKED